MDERTRRAIEEEPPWGRPAWLIEQAQLVRYPMLWEAVRTSWRGSPDLDRASLSQRLVDHTNHVLRNSFRAELRLPAGPSQSSHDWEVTIAAVSGAATNVDGRDQPAVHIDTDPFVYGIGFRVDESVVCTTVVPRDALALIDLTHTTFE